MPKPIAKWKRELKKRAKEMWSHDLLDELMGEVGGIDVSTDPEHDNAVIDILETEMRKRLNMLAI